jgi:hypothetical protein
MASRLVLFSSRSASVLRCLSVAPVNFVRHSEVKSALVMM